MDQMFLLLDVCKGEDDSDEQYHLEVQAHVNEESQGIQSPQQ
jgi:hypothetical protein